jgi:hypothetical protein
MNAPSESCQGSTDSRFSRCMGSERVPAFYKEAFSASSPGTLGYYDQIAALASIKGRPAIVPIAHSLTEPRGSQS